MADDVLWYMQRKLSCQLEKYDFKIGYGWARIFKRILHNSQRNDWYIQCSAFSTLKWAHFKIFGLFCFRSTRSTATHTHKTDYSLLVSWLRHHPHHTALSSSLFFYFTHHHRHNYRIQWLNGFFVPFLLLFYAYFCTFIRLFRTETHTKPKLGGKEAKEMYTYYVDSSSPYKSIKGFIKYFFFFGGLCFRIVLQLLTLKAN